MSAYTNPDGVAVHDGFPNPATDTRLQNLDLHSLLVKHPVSTYFMLIQGDSWQDQGIHHNDIVLIDRALQPRRNDLVVWWQDDEFRLSPKHIVPPSTPVFGVVSATIHQYRKLL